MKKAFLLFIFFIVISEAGFEKISNTFSGDAPQRWHYAAITRSNTAFGDIEPYLKIECDMTNVPKDGVMPNLQMVLFHHQNLFSRVGYQENFFSKWCCTEEFYRKGMCLQPGQIFLGKDTNLENVEDKRYLMDINNAIYYWPNFRSYKNESYNIEEEVLIFREKIIFDRTGIWYLIINQCVNESFSPVQAQGFLEWRNPYGYLSGIQFPYLPMCICISVAFFILFLVWIIFVFKYRSDLMGLHHIVTVAIIVALLENVLWSFDYINKNIYGQNYDFVNVVGVLLTTCKLTVIRTCILLVSLGYSITVPTLEYRTRICVIVLTLVYGISTAVAEYGWLIRTMGLQFPGVLHVFAYAVLILANITYAIWAGYSLFKQYRSLSEAKQTVKLDMYFKFILALVLFFVISMVLFFIQSGLLIADKLDDLWQLWWIWDAYWEFGYFFVVLLIAVLWWPNENNKRYAYSVQIDADAEEMGTFGLPSSDEDDDPKTNVRVPEDDQKDIKSPNHYDSDEQEAL